ncbi:MAG: UDP-3-O-(3-hydroxymyristoyl)glucosamine N-acyltransferase [Mariprofundus sp.]
MNSLSIAEAVAMVNGTLDGASVDVSHQVYGVNTLRDASDVNVSFLANKHYKDEIATTRAAVVLIAADMPCDNDRAVIRVPDPYLAFALLQQYFYPAAVASGKRHNSAVIAADAVVAADVDIAARAIIGAGVVIGSGCIIGPGCIIGDGVVLDEHCLLHANAVVQDGCVLGKRVILQPGAVVGSDGFGYAWSGQAYVKIPQIGRVILEDDVEIGANSCIDRGAIGDTVIERGVKLDNLVQIAHNVRVGAFSVMASQVGVSGSTQVGRGCQFGGQAGLAGHIKVGDGCKLAGKTGVMSDLEAGGTYGGMPAMPQRQWLRVTSILQKLPELWKTLRPRG